MAFVRNQVKNISGISPSRNVKSNDKVISNTVETIDADTTLETQDVLLADGSSNTVTLTLPSPEFEGQSYTIEAINVTNAVDVDTEGSETIDGASSYTFTTQYDSITVVSDGDNYFVVAEQLNA